ncbi:invasion associated locus B family protein [Ensifer sp. YR511]|uniref:invasion associated locus B family protein n=1 Tax=Ensifer sp. YR511 TaxID=1855294 RepID=UPI000B7EE7E9|nr:invasion associated locus B family protein [Ensifer sp. YR511]
MSRKRVLGLSAVAILLIGATGTFYVAPAVAISNPTQALAATDSFGDPAPQRFEVAQAQTGGASTLPGGASSLNEAYRHWRVGCVQQGTTKRCAMSQVQTQQNGQRVLAIELSPPVGNIVTGTLVLPFGLALDAGVTFQIDDKPAMQPVRFRTCLPGGCLVNVSFDAATLVALRAGAALKLRTTADGGTVMPFTISLQGFGTALDRVATLSR